MDASIPHQYYSSDYSSLSTDLCSFPTSEETSSDIIMNANCNNGAINYMAPLMSYDISSPVSVASFPDQQLLGVGANSDSMLEVPQMLESETAGFSNFDNYQQFGHQVFEPGEDCIGLVPRLWPAYNDIHHKLIPAQNWSLHGNPIITKAEETEVKVGRYSAEEKKDRILRYLKKKNQRNFNKTIKYACRKTLADKRVRVRGRFAKNNDQPSEDELVMATSQNNLSFENYLQMKYEEDCWLQAAMANLMHSPYC
ncbi:hypothetical protein STAS_30252 [Striga asiatica]|uniref:CCT domain-containing protein n=1 Tax=Striga asiatica TaxID=4170 RepID=A0A5A7R520_STRAF|nr:hypothetical protein STAS_30252 [Striga asiatica]